MRLKNVLWMIALGIVAVTPLRSAAEDLPAVKVEVSGANHLDSQTILVPTVLLNLSVDGTLFEVSRNGDANAQAKGAFVVSGLERTFVQELAGKVQQDLVDRLRAAGYTVLTYDDIKGDPQAVKLNRREVSPRHGLPYRDDKSSSVNHVIATPSDAQAFKPPIQGPHWAFKGIAKERNAVVIIPELWIASPQMWAEKETGYRSASAEINIAPGMNVGSAFAWIINPKAAGTMVKLEHAISNVTESAGTLANVGKEKTDLGFAKKVKSAWNMTVDPAAYAAGVLRGAGAFNAAITEAFVKENPPRAASN